MNLQILEVHYLNKLLNIIMKLNKNIIILITIIITVIIFILTISLTVASFKKVHHDEFAIAYNPLTHSVDKSKIYKEGRYFLVLPSYFFKYKRTITSIEFSDNEDIQCLTKEGLNMFLSITVQYQIIEDKLFDIFEIYGKEEYWIKYLILKTKSTIKDTCGNFTGEDFFFNRGIIESNFTYALTQMYLLDYIEATIGFVQLKNVKHPPSYEVKNQEKQTIEQEKDRALSNREQQITVRTTKLLTQIKDNEIILIRANATAQSEIIKKTEQAKAIFAKYQERAISFSTIKYKLSNGTNNNEIIETFIKYLTIITQQNIIIKI